jgi:hypothetical protein
MRKLLVDSIGTVNRNYSIEHILLPFMLRVSTHIKRIIRHQLKNYVTEE